MKDTRLYVELSKVKVAPLYTETDLNSRMSRSEDSVTPLLRVAVVAMSPDSSKGPVEKNPGIFHKFNELEMLSSVQSGRNSNEWLGWCVIH
jgi:hypothetical protein